MCTTKKIICKYRTNVALKRMQYKIDLNLVIYRKKTYFSRCNRCSTNMNYFEFSESVKVSHEIEWKNRETGQHNKKWNEGESLLANSKTSNYQRISPMTVSANKKHFRSILVALGSRHPMKPRKMVFHIDVRSKEYLFF